MKSEIVRDLSRLKKTGTKYLPHAAAGASAVVLGSAAAHALSKNQYLRNKISIVKQYIVARSPISEKVIGDVFNKRYQINKHLVSDFVGATGIGIDKVTGDQVLIKEIPVKNVDEIKSELNVTKLKKYEFVLRCLAQKYFMNNLYIVYDYPKNTGLLYNSDKFVRGVVALNLMKGLEYLHNNNLAHNNINLKNILVDTNSNIKYINFEASCYKMCNVDATGTDIHYLPPEKIARLQQMANGDRRQSYPFKLAKAGDVWSLGAVIYTIFTGSFPPEDYNQIKNISVGKDVFLVVAVKMMEPDPVKRMSISSALRDLKINKFQRLFSF